MYRVNGYIDLDAYFEDLGETSSSLEKKHLVAESDYINPHQYWITINNEEYYFKEMLFNPYPELICSDIARLLDIEAIDYDLAIFKGYKGVISKSYRKNGAKYISGSKILANLYRCNPSLVEQMGLDQVDWKKGAKQPWYFHMNNLMMMWHGIEEYFPGADIKMLMEKVVNQFMFMLLTEQYDRGAQNIEFEEINGKVDVVPLYDNESAFSGINDAFGINMAFTTEFSDCEGFLKEVLKTFLSKSSSEYVNLFLEKYDLLNEENFMKIIQGVERKTKCSIPEKEKVEIINNYQRNYANIKDVLTELKLNNMER